MSVAANSSERTEPVRKLIWLATACLVAFGAVVSLIGAAWWIGGPVISAGTLKALRGSTQADVRRILGEPNEIMHDGDWIYDRPPNPGWVAISFDEGGSVQSVNDEQVDPVLFGSGSCEPDAR